MDKTQKVTQNEIIFLVEKDPLSGYTARSLGESIFTEAHDIETLRKNIRDAIQCHYPNPAERPRIIRLHEVHEEIFEA
jgi:hypothetical protein